MRNEVIRIEHKISPQLAKEIESLQKGWSCDVRELGLKYPDIDSYTREYFETFWGLELKERFNGKDRAKIILDIGAGRGESSIYLGSLGHKVSCIEPSYVGCKTIEYISNKFCLPLKIYQCSAEYLNQISDTNYDLCIFNNSLHHCDDPLKALKNCYEILQQGGSVLIINEIFLRRYKSKKSFYKFMSDNPTKSGDYGGNEHSYYYYEYMEMLKKAGFLKIKEYIPFRYGHYGLMKKNLKTVLRHRYNNFDLLLRYIYFGCLSKIFKAELLRKSVLPFLKHMSLIQVSLEGIKNK